MKALGWGATSSKAIGSGAFGGSPGAEVVGFGGSSTFSGSAKPTHNDTSAVLEPMSLMMVALGLGGIDAVRRFRRPTC